MTRADPLASLLHQLSTGDAEAARRVFEAYVPYLRMVVRRQLTPELRPKFDSMDIVQSAWVDLLAGFQAGRWQFRTPDDLRLFLVQVTRNRLIDHARKQQKPIRLEQRLEDGDLQELPQAGPTPVGAELEAEETWHRLLALCPARHRGLLELKRQGLTVVEVAARTGLHEGSVRRILADLASRLAEGDRPPHLPGHSSS
jgi:RNA polymerase sigma-70 factor (ECF subfamily)